MSQMHLAPRKTELAMLADFDGMEHLSARLASIRFPVHFHETFVIQYIHSGADWCCVNDVVAQQGEIFVHFPLAAHTGGTFKELNLAYQAIYPSTRLFADIVGVNASKIPTGQSWASSDRDLVRSVKRVFESLSSISSIETRSAIHEVFHRILDTSNHFDHGGTHSESIHGKLDSARNYLVKNVNLDVSIVELSENCGLSKFHLIRAFKQRFGITPRRFLISQRVMLAKQLMKGGAPITQAAFGAGFNDQSHLTRCFKQLTSFSPGQFKSAIQN